MDNNLTEFITKRTHLKADEIGSELRLAEDIGFYGLDAVTFMQEFFSEFKIENYDDFDFDLHIDGGPDFAPRPGNWLRSLFVKERRKYLRPDVSIGHLLKVIEKGKWFNEK